MTPFEILFLVLMVAALFLLMGGEFSFRKSDEDEPIIYRCPPSGDPFAGGYFEVPRNSEGEEFVRRVIKATTPSALGSMRPEDLEAAFAGFGKPPKREKTEEEKKKEEAYEAHLARSNKYL